MIHFKPLKLICLNEKFIVIEGFSKLRLFRTFLFSRTFLERGKRIARELDASAKLKVQGAGRVHSTP